VQVVEPHQGRVGDDTGGIDQLRRPFLQHYPGDRVDPLAHLVQQSLDEAGLSLGVVIEQDHRIGGVLGDRAVDCRPKAEVFSQLHYPYLRQLAAGQLDRVVIRAVVDQDDVDRPRLRAEAAQGPAQLGRSVEIWDVYGWSHALFAAQ
jgi:hypothetical protein